MDTNKEEKLKSIAVTASIFDLSIPADRVCDRSIRELQMSIHMDARNHSTLNSWTHKISLLRHSSSSNEYNSYRNRIFFAKEYS